MFLGIGAATLTAHGGQTAHHRMENLNSAAPKPDWGCL
jgi:hypothetical protein